MTISAQEDQRGQTLCLRGCSHADILIQIQNQNVSSKNVTFDFDTYFTKEALHLVDVLQNMIEADIVFETTQVAIMEETL